jgi:hypothetical protein
VLVCFDSIFNTNGAKLDARSKAIRAKNLKRSASASTPTSTPTSSAASTSSTSTSGATNTQGQGSGGSGSGGSGGGGGSGGLVYLVQDLYEAGELLDSELVERMGAVWQVLVTGQVLHHTYISTY